MDREICIKTHRREALSTEKKRNLGSIKIVKNPVSIMFSPKVIGGSLQKQVCGYQPKIISIDQAEKKVI